MKAATVRERLEDFVTTFENPEISAMAAISRILEDLQDDAARLRVMRWAFGKYGEEFKRPVVEAPAAPVVPLKPTLVPEPRPAAPVASIAPLAPVAPAPPVAIADDAPATEPADFDRQVAELSDMFSDRPDGMRLARPRQR
jgi:hypothetical protein